MRLLALRAALPAATFLACAMSAVPGGSQGDPKEKFAQNLKLARDGDAAAQYRVGLAYKHGRGVTEDPSAALLWFRKAAEQGHPEAQNSVGYAYSHGLGVVQDVKEAARWYLEAAGQGNITAQFNAGLCCAKGRGVPRDDVQAHVWFNLAAAQNHEEARKKRDEVAAMLSPEDLARAQRLAVEWKPTKPSTVHESWFLYLDGKPQFPNGSLEMDFQPKEPQAKREIPLPIPNAAAPGHYELRLKASFRETSLEKSFSFEVR